MTWRQDVAEGWRLGRPILSEAYTPRRRAALVGAASAVGVGVSAILHPLIAPSTGEPESTLVALAGGTMAGVILTLVVAVVQRKSAGGDRYKSARTFTLALSLLGLPVPYLFAAAAAFPSPLTILLVLFAATSTATPLTTFAAFGRAAIIEREKAASGDDASTPKTSKPYRVLGTDHPDDYS